MNFVKPHFCLSKKKTFPLVGGSSQDLEVVRITLIYKPWKDHLQEEQPYLGDVNLPWLLTTYVRPGARSSKQPVCPEAPLVFERFPRAWKYMEDLFTRVFCMRPSLWLHEDLFGTGGFTYIYFVDVYGKVVGKCIYTLIYIRLFTILILWVWQKEQVLYEWLFQRIGFPAGIYCISKNLL